MDFRLHQAPEAGASNSQGRTTLFASTKFPEKQNKDGVPQIETSNDEQVLLLRAALEHEKANSVEKERKYQEALRVAFEREQNLRQQLARLEALQIKNRHKEPLIPYDNKSKVDKLISELRENAEISINLANDRARNAENRAKAYKESLVKAKMFQLHTALEKMTLEYNRKEKKFKAIIAGLQGDKNDLVEKLVQYERNGKSL